MVKTKMKTNKLYLNPGQLVIAENTKIVWTLLGSCISIIFHNQEKKISAVSHAQLPYEKSNLSCKSTCPKPCGKDEKDEFKYVTCSFKYMLEEFHNRGIKNKDIEVSLFGGSSMFRHERDMFKIGEMNINKAKELIRQHKLKIVDENTGGNSSRTLTHYSDTGITDLKVDGRN